MFTTSQIRDQYQAAVDYARSGDTSTAIAALVNANDMRVEARNDVYEATSVDYATAVKEIMG